MIHQVLDLAHQIMGFPRHLSQHVGGFVLTRAGSTALVPVGNAAMENRTFIEWDKDDIDALGILKVDVLALGMLTCIRKALRPARGLNAWREYGLDCRIEDPKPYMTCCAGPTRSACFRWKAARR
jgi:error-prone DNA polymerase